MITLTIDSHYIPSQERQSESYKLKKISLKFFQQSLHAAHLLKLLDMTYIYISFLGTFCLHWHDSFEIYGATLSFVKTRN